MIPDLLIQMLESAADVGPVYHGTSSGGFSQFGPPAYRKNEQLAFGIHFWEDPAPALQYASDPDVARRGKRPQVYKAMLRIQNLLDLTSTQIVYDDSPLWELVIKLSPRGRPLSLRDGDRQCVFLPNVIDACPARKAERILRDAGYDGVRYQGKIGKGRSVYGTVHVSYSGPAYVVFDPGQIRILD